MEYEIGHYVRFLELQNYSKSHLKNARCKLGLLQKFMQTRAILEVTDITEEDLLGFMLEVKKRKSNLTGEGLASATVSFYVTYVKNFFRYLKEKNLILVDPSKKLRFARRGVKLPRGYFTEKEMQSILKAIDINEILGIRDRALLELLYSTGLRSQEILSLNVEDVDFAKELVFVGFGKGGKERMTPVGKHALFWVAHYLENARSKILRGKEVPGLFVSLNRKIMENYHLNQRIRIYKAKAGVGKIGGAHLFRHSCATHMLQHGADIRYVQEMLGHERISTTSVYTKVSLVHLKEAYHKVFA